jgi:hypothetical protein
MQVDLPNLDFDTLKEMYSDARYALNQDLLNGASWNEVQELRHIVTDLEAALHKRIYSSNPAESENRKTA